MSPSFHHVTSGADSSPKPASCDKHHTNKEHELKRVLLLFSLLDRCNLRLSLHCTSEEHSTRLSQYQASSFALTCTLRTQMLDCACLSSFSKYTPANPEVRAAKISSMRP